MSAYYDCLWCYSMRGSVYKMDMFVKCIDSRLQDPLVYEKLLVHGDGHEGEISYLNTLINKTTSLVRQSQGIPIGIEYTEYSNDKKFSNNILNLCNKCIDVVKKIEYFINLLKNNDDINDEEIFDLLLDEIDEGINRHIKSTTKSYDDHNNNNTSTSINILNRPLKISNDIIINQDFYSLYNTPLDKFILKIDIKNYIRLKNRPQLQWKEYFDNFSNKQISHNKIKYNSLKPEIVINDNEFINSNNFNNHKMFIPMIYPKIDIIDHTPEISNNFYNNKPHPYSSELYSLEWTNLDINHTHKGSKLLGGGTLFNMLESLGKVNSGYKLIEDETGLMSMIDELSRSSIVAIDVEHYSGESYRGFVCLVQFSTIESDWVVDPFRIFGLMHNLNIITTDPKILKIMHGADNDIIWLQRDFGIYVVNMFDTLQAAKLLHIKGGQSLASLLFNYCNIIVNKMYQLADWRIRPIPADMLDYASGDTHHLLELYNILKNIALSMDDGKNKIVQIMLNSRNVCLKQYTEKPLRLYTKAKTICKKSNILLRTMDYISYNYMLNLILFRDYVAKELDECEKILLPDHFIIKLTLKSNVSL